jgi:glycosyltransferase involved in cell wall biosynthesis
MRVCIIYDCLFPFTVGGAERWYRALAERLAAEGHDVTYVTLRQWERNEPPTLDGVRVLAVGPRFDLYTKGGRRRILPPLVFGLGVLAHLLRRGGSYDVVHTCSFPYFSLLSAALARRAHRYGLVVDWQEVWTSAYWRQYLGSVGGAIGHRVQRLCAHVSQQAFCFSRLHASRLRAEGLRGEVIVLEGEYVGSLEAPHVREVEPVVLFAARMIPEKRAPLAVSAFGLAAARVKGLRGELYGDGPERQAVLEAIAEQGLAQVLSAPGFVEASRVDEAFGRAMCLLSTSSREGYGMVVIEAAAHATPSVVVAGEDNASVELLEEGVNGLVAPSDDPAVIADAIVRVHEAGMAMRQSTAVWFNENGERLSLGSSLAKVLATYASVKARA